MERGEKVIQFKSQDTDPEGLKEALRQRLRGEIEQAAQAMGFDASDDSEYMEVTVGENEENEDYHKKIDEEANQRLLLGPARLSRKDLDIAMYGGENEKERKTPFIIGDRYAQLGSKAEALPKNDPDKSVKGAQSVLLRAVFYIMAEPETAQKCLEYAWQVWNKERDFNPHDIPKPEPRHHKLGEEWEHEVKRKQASG